MGASHVKRIAQVIYIVNSKQDREISQRNDLSGELGQRNDWQGNRSGIILSLIMDFYRLRVFAVAFRLFEFP